MSHENQKEYLLKQLSKTSKNQAFVESEIADIYNGDIPYFTYSNLSNDIFNSCGRKIDFSVFKSTTDCIKHQLTMFSDGDLYEKLEVIKKSIL